jgi:hypothetical protein
MPPRKKVKAKFNLREFCPKPDFLKSLGFDRPIEQKDIVELQIRFLEELCKTWKFTHKRYELMNEKPDNLREELLKIHEEEQPYIDYIKEIFNAIAFIRAVLFQATQHQMYREKKLLQQCRQQQLQEYENCRQSFDYFCDYWVWIHEPRFPEMGLSAKIPFVRFLKQREVTADIHLAYTSRQNLLIEKAREQGISWLACAYLAWHWMFTPGFTAIIASEKEEKVDIIGTTKTLFGKIRYILYNLPPWMLPTTFQKDLSEIVMYGPNDNFKKLLNPDLKSEITGEAGLNIGRSGRASMVVIDEFQSITTPDQLDAALESVTNCRIDIGTPMGMNHFGQKRFSNTVLVSTLHWYDDPRKTTRWQAGAYDDDSEWLKYKLATTKDKTILAQEYFLDYNASVEDSVIPSDWVAAAVDLEVEPTGINQSGLDVADSGENKCMYARRVGPKVFPLEEITFQSPAAAVLDSISKAERDHVEIYAYDRDGVGISVPTVMELLEKQPAFFINAVRNQETALEKYIDEEGLKASEKYANRRAQNWYMLANRFKKAYEHRNQIHLYPAEELISIPDDRELIAQLSQPKKKLKGKRMAVESKKDMKSRGVKSPDKADALGLSFAETEDVHQVVSKFDYTSHKRHYTRYEIDVYEANTSQYVSIYQTPDLAIHAIGCIWNSRKRLLRPYWNYSEIDPSAEAVIREAHAKMNPLVNDIKEWIGNSEMFKGIKSGSDVPYYHFRKCGVRLRENYTNDTRGSIMTLNDMFENNMIQIHNPECEKLMYQIFNWTKKHGKPTMDLGLVLALSQLVTRLKAKRLIKPPRRDPVGYNMYKRFGKADPQRILNNLK